MQDVNGSYTLIQVPMSSAWLKPSIPQNCSIAYKYAQHLLLTNKKIPPAETAHFHERIIIWLEKAEEKRKKIAVLWTSLFRPERQGLRWLGHRWHDAWRWLMSHREGGRGGFGSWRNQKADYGHENRKPCKYSRGREALSARQGNASGIPTGERPEGRGKGTELHFFKRAACYSRLSSPFAAATC